MPSGDDHAWRAPHTAIALDPIATRHVADGLHGDTHDDWRSGSSRVLLEKGRKLLLRHEAVGIGALIGPARKPVHPVGRQEPQRIPAFSVPAFRYPASLQNDVVESKPAEAGAHGKPSLPGADDDRVSSAHGAPPPTSAGGRCDHRPRRAAFRSSFRLKPKRRCAGCRARQNGRMPAGRFPAASRRARRP